jgi:hypothetical protein
MLARARFVVCSRSLMISGLGAFWSVRRRGRSHDLQTSCLGLARSDRATSLLMMGDAFSLLLYLLYPYVYL